MESYSLSSRWCVLVIFVMAMCVGGMADVRAQELGGAGTLQGTVKDPTGGVMVAVTVTIVNAVSGFRREATTDAGGRFTFGNLPPNPYRLEVTAQGFAPLQRDLDVRTAVPIDLTLTLTLAAASSDVQVVGRTTDLVERDPTAHTDVDQGLVEKLPVESSAGLNQVITLASPGVVADANGFFHPIGDHAQTQFSIDNQPVTDQQSRIYSNQISPDAVQSMEIITGVPPAEFGDKDSLVVRIITKSGLDQRPTGSALFQYGSFRSPATEASFGFGSHQIGNFLSFSGLRTDRFLDSPEFEALHGEGNSQSFFDRLDFHPTERDTLHLNLHLARSSFDVPNTLDQNGAGQAQHQQITTFNFAPGYSRVLSPNALLTANGYVRRDHVTYQPSPNPLSDESGSVSQDRTLTNFGGKLDIAYTKGAHNIKFGGSVNATKLTENFTLGVTDPTINSPCADSVDPDGNPVNPSPDTSLTSPGQCRRAGLVANPAFSPDLLAFDLSRGGTPFGFQDEATIKEQAFYVQDDIKVADATFKLGLRGDHYNGFTSSSLLEPRLGASYALPGGGPVVRASYGRTQETPYNENLLLASSPQAAIFGTAGIPLPTGTRDQVEVGAQQAFGRWIVADVGYFYKHTDNGYDFGVLFTTPIAFPISWDHSKISGITARIHLVEHRGFSAFTVMGHTSAIFSPPGTGGILQSLPPGDFRIDHDQKFQQTTNAQYVFDQSTGLWAAFSWRYDSGLVAGSVPDYATALTLTADQQAAIGLFCGGTVATPTSAITNCSDPNRGATRLKIPADGTVNDVTNPPRIAPRHLFDLGIGVDNLLKSKRAKVRAKFTVINLTNEEALYNFLSTFSGTHFVTPRAYQVQVGVTF
jgi:hypothetical protein